MANGCLCGTPNTGIGSCELVAGVPVGFFFVKLVADDGTLNSVDYTDTFDDAARDAYINNPDPSKRWYPLTRTDFVRITPVVPTATNGDFGTPYYANKLGSQNVEFQVINGGEAWAARIGEALDCGEWGVFIVDKKGQLLVQRPESGTLVYPKAITSGSFLATHAYANMGENTPSKTTFSFGLDQSNIPSEAAILGGISTNLLRAVGLVEVTGVYSNITATGFTLTLTAFSSSATPVPVSGLLTGAFVITNITDSATITTTAFSETTDGVYSFTFASQTSADKFKTAVTATGYDTGSVVAQIKQIP